MIHLVGNPIYLNNALYEIMRERGLLVKMYECCELSISRIKRDDILIIVPMAIDCCDEILERLIKGYRMKCGNGRVLVITNSRDTIIEKLKRNGVVILSSGGLSIKLFLKTLESMLGIEL